MNSIEEKCQKKGVRLTDQRKIIAKVLSESKEVYGSKDHPDVDELHKRVSDIDKKISIATVYRTVKLFEESGILEKHDFKGGKARYEPSLDEHQAPPASLQMAQSHRSPTRARSAGRRPRLVACARCVRPFAGQRPLKIACGQNRTEPAAGKSTHIRGPAAASSGDLFVCFVRHILVAGAYYRTVVHVQTSQSWNIFASRANEYYRIFAVSSMCRTALHCASARRSLGARARRPGCGRTWPASLRG